MTDSEKTLSIVRKLLSNASIGDPEYQLFTSLCDTFPDDEPNRRGISRKGFSNFLYVLARLLRICKDPNEALLGVFHLLDDLDLLHWEKIEAIFDLDKTHDNHPAS